MSLTLFPATCERPTRSRTGHGVFGFPMNTRSDEAGWEGRNLQLGARIGVVWPLSRALDPAKENNYALNHRNNIYCVPLGTNLERKFSLTICGEDVHG